MDFARFVDDLLPPESVRLVKDGFIQGLKTIIYRPF